MPKEKLSETIERQEAELAKWRGLATAIAAKKPMDWSRPSGDISYVLVNGGEFGLKVAGDTVRVLEAGDWGREPGEVLKESGVWDRFQQNGFPAPMTSDAAIRECRIQGWQVGFEMVGDDEVRCYLLKDKNRAGEAVVPIRQVGDSGPNYSYTLAKSRALRAAVADAKRAAAKQASLELL